MWLKGKNPFSTVQTSRLQLRIEAEMYEETVIPDEPLKEMETSQVIPDEPLKAMETSQFSDDDISN